MTRHADERTRPVVMLLGSGEVSRELTLSFQRLGASVIAVDRYADAPAHRVADRSAVVPMNDPKALAATVDNERPDYVVVEGPLAGGHLGFGMDWATFDLATIVAEIRQYLLAEQLDIPLIPAGGIFTGTDAVNFLEMGAAAVQVATRFTVAKECGLPEAVQQHYFKASEDEIEVNQISPTGYPMRMLKSSPAIGSGIRPNCEAYGYLLDSSGNCQYIEAYNREVAAHPEAKKVKVFEKTCLCTHMRNFDCWTCGHYTYRLKDTSVREDNGDYRILTAEHIFRDYQFSTDNKIALPA